MRKRVKPLSQYGGHPVVRCSTKHKSYAQVELCIKQQVVKHNAWAEARKVYACPHYRTFLEIQASARQRLFNSELLKTLNLRVAFVILLDDV